MNSKIW